ncbi:MAG: hypothetical protein N5P05_001497 [Chroococcopsis gigantea SAG 12.99]|jgi:hypothetical protein|nr:VWA domain-containing protein [Chlorogloea purpurea SAG 13.99]MDV2999891.1 hypothetical protein [Chroococcopsis gigantea SAG 12.99]
MNNISFVSKKISLPTTEINSIFGKVTYQIIGEEAEITFTILMPSISEGFKTGVALDASSSMKGFYGKLPRSQENIVETEARKFLYYLADRLDADGETTAIYWACSGVKQIEIIGSFQASQCADLTIEGPVEEFFGSMTNLLPALSYFVETFTLATNGLYIFVTDGQINDFLEVKKYCIDLAKDIAIGERNPLKCVLIGLGEKIDTKQMAELDNLDGVTGLDLWDYHVAKDMREITDIFAELVDESVMVAPVATIYDDRDRPLTRFTDGLPGRVTFRLPRTATYFELEVAQQRIRQPLSIVKQEIDK